MPLTVRSSARRRRKTPDEKLPERPGESSSAQVMAPTRMKLRVRRRDTAAAAGGGQPEEEEATARSRESGGRSSRRKNTNNTSTPAAASSPAPSSSAAASARAVMAAEEASPDSKCPICLDRFNNLAYLDRCLHRFCFPCIQEWSHNKAECPLCKQPFASILHSVRAEDDFKEYTLRPAPANSSVAATVAMVAAMASAARSDHQMRLMLRRHRGADGSEAVTRRRRRERGGRGGAGRRAGVWEWYLDSPPLALPPLPHHPAVSPVVAEDSEEGEDVEEQRARGGADLAERGVIFEGLTGLSGAVAPVALNDRASRRLMTRLVARQRLQREGGAVRWLRERETVAFRRALYRSAIRVRGVAGLSAGQQRDITAESFRRNPTHLNRLRPWLRRELTVLYGAHGSLVDIVQRIIMARLARHGLEDTPTIEEELRPFLLARTDHFLHELVSFARSPLSLENYDLQAVYEPPAAAATMELDGTSSSSESSSVIAISEGEDEERLAARPGGAHNDVLQAGSSLSLAAWDDETPGPSYSTADQACSLSSPPFSPAPQEAANEERGEKREEEEECLIVGYKKPIAERTPELVQLSSDTEDDDEKKEDATAPPEEKLPPLAATAPPPLSYLPTIPPSTSGACRDEPEKDVEPDVHGAHSWSCSSGRNSVCTLSPATPDDSERPRERWRDRKRAGGEAAREKRKKKRKRRGRERSGTLYNPNRSIYPAMMRHRSHSPSPFQSSVESGSPLSPSPPASSWEYHCSQVSPLTSSVSSLSRSSSYSSSSSSPLCSSPRPSSQTPQTPSLSPGHAHHGGEKPGGKRKYKSRHLDSDDKDPTWRPSSGRSRERRRERGEKDRRRRGRRRERQRRDGGGRRRSRDERSPSVEIIYEGTISAGAAQPPAKRRRKRPRKTPHSSSPVIITLDSDSSHGDDIIAGRRSSSSSSRLSSQQTVDFSDLPPLPLAHSAAALNAEIGDLPADILDRGSDGSDTEPAGRSDGPIAIDNSEDSDHDVDVENVDEGGSPPESDDTKGSMRASDTNAGESAAAKRDPEVSTSDSRLLASILSDLKGLAAPKSKPSANVEPSSSPDARKKPVRDPCAARSDRGDRPGETRRQSNEVIDQNDFPLCRTAIRPPPLEWLKASKDVPPLLKQASPVRSHNRNTPPPLKHKDAGSPRLSPAPPVDLQSAGAASAGLNSHTDLSSSPALPPADSRLRGEDNPTIPPISTLKRRFMRGGPAAAGGVLANDTPSSCHLAPIDSRSAAPSKVGAPNNNSTNVKVASENISTLEFNSFHSVKLLSKEIFPSGPRLSPVDFQPVNSLFHPAKTSKENPAPADSRGCRNTTQSPNSCRVEPVDLHPSSGAPAGGALAGGGVFSGVNHNDASPPASVSSFDSWTQKNSSATIDSHFSSRRENLSESVFSSSVPSKSPAGTFSPADHPGIPKSAADLRSSHAASDDLKDPSLVNHGESSPPVDLHCRVPPADVRSSVGAALDGHVNHTALSSATFHTPHRKCTEPADSHSKLLRLADSKPHNHFDLRSDPPLPVGSHPNSRPGTDFRLPADNHATSSPESDGGWSAAADARSDSAAPADERSAGGQWNTHTHSAT